MSDGFRTAPVKLHEEVQRWIWSQGWDKLRPIQEQAIAPILSGNTDLIISAATAGGKTETAILPLNQDGDLPYFSVGV
jgi:ATP-dependent helicase Lhr and Lhr-like helicase